MYHLSKFLSIDSNRDLLLQLAATKIPGSVCRPGCRTGTMGSKGVINRIPVPQSNTAARPCRLPQPDYSTQDGRGNFAIRDDGKMTKVIRTR